jgi:hypothetical protein
MAPSSEEKSEFIDMVVKEAMQFKTWVQFVFDGHPKEYLHKQLLRGQVHNPNQRLAIMRSVLSTSRDL